MVFDIVTGEDNPILRKVSSKHEKITKKTLKFIKDMVETLIVDNGAGIAAPQVGVNTRIVIVTINKKQILPLVNPEILDMSQETDIDTEGCLSLPGKWGPVERASEITLRFTDTTGRQVTMKLKDFEARVVQHEVDHLNGILFVDHVPEGKLQVEG